MQTTEQNTLSLDKLIQTLISGLCSLTQERRSGKEVELRMEMYAMGWEELLTKELLGSTLINDSQVPGLKNRIRDDGIRINGLHRTVEVLERHKADLVDVNVDLRNKNAGLKKKLERIEEKYNAFDDFMWKELS